MARPKIARFTQEETTLQGLSSLAERVEFFRLDAARRLDEKQRGEFGQFFTPEPVARMMASLFEAKSEKVTILDAGA